MAPLRYTKLAGSTRATPGGAPGLSMLDAVLSGKPVEGAADWAGYSAPDGRTYYYNAKTGVSTWEKPSA